MHKIRINNISPACTLGSSSFRIYDCINKLTDII